MDVPSDGDRMIMPVAHGMGNKGFGMLQDQNDRTNCGARLIDRIGSVSLSGLQTWACGDVMPPAVFAG